ncbi:MAG TPA: MerR family transcriptional regulator [Acidimicrobiales bacterium]|nr:MerR family transcriptional regulator [Acidimicrobiales bacterium]
MADELSGEFVSVSVAAKIAHVEAPAIREWVTKGWLSEHRTAGGHRRISVDEVRALTAAGPQARRARRIDDLRQAVDEWGDQLVDFSGWRPPKHLSDDQLARLRSDIGGFDGTGGLIADLLKLHDRITDELHRRDDLSA